jgi:predicted transposase/invertase (TIGR01784 family)
VFKAIFGSEENKDVLIHLLNAILVGSHPRIQAVDILNPYNEREFEDARGSVVDIRATTDAGSQIQIEMQTSNHSDLRERMIWT